MRSSAAFSDPLGSVVTACYRHGSYGCIQVQLSDVGLTKIDFFDADQRPQIKEVELSEALKRNLSYFETFLNLYQEGPLINRPGTYRAEPSSSGGKAWLSWGKVKVPIQTQWSAFQQRVSMACLQIPYGQSASYSALGHELGGRHYARAVGGALAANSLLLLIPCHRIHAQDRSVRGYRGGLENLRRLWEHEGINSL